MHPRYELARLSLRKSLAALSAVLTLLLAGCASRADLPAVYHPPRAPDAKVVQEGVKKAATETKLTGALEMTAARPTDHGPGAYFACLRQSGSPSGRHPAYSVFFDNDAYKGIQSSVILEASEAEAWVPFN